MMKAARGQELVSCPTARTRQLADLSEEMIIEILLRLPARTLVSLKSVCTSWRNLISSPDFTRNHLRRSCLHDPTLTPPRIAFYDHWSHGYGGIGVFYVQSMMDNPSGPIKVDYFKGERYYGIIGSCNGLICLFDEHAYHNLHAILWNPCTGFTFQSPQISGRTFLTGFGYDHLSDSYKFCATIRKRGPSGLERSTRIYTFGPTSSWRRIDDIPFSLLGLRNDMPCFAANREGEFFRSSRVCTVNWSVYHVVLYFDLGKETYGHFPLPEIDLDDYPQRLCTHLCVLGNCLSVCYEHKRTHKWIVWQMKEYGDAQSWTKLVVIPVHPKSTCSNPYHCLQPFSISESDVLLAFSSSSRIILCNLNDGSINFPVIGRSFPQGFRHRMAYIYHESLVSPNGLQSNSSLLPFIQPKPIDS